MKIYNQDKLPMLLLDRLAEYAKMDWWYLETYSKKTVTVEQLTDLFNAFMVENLQRFEQWEVLEIYRIMVLTVGTTQFYDKELIKTIQCREVTI